MNIRILPMAYRRYLHSIRRSSIMERTLPKMKNDDQLKAKPGEVATLRASNSVPVKSTNNAILAHSNNLSNRSVITV